MKKRQPIDGWFMPGWVLRDTKLSPTGKLVLGLIVKLHEKQGMKASNAYIAASMGISDAAARQAVHRLRRDGYLEPVKSQFPHSFEGERCTPTYHTQLRGVTHSHMGVTHSYGGVTKSYIDRNVQEMTVEREGGLGNQFSEEWIERLSGLVAERGYERKQVEEEVRLIGKELSAGFCDPVSNWPGFIEDRLVRRKRAMAAGKKPVQTGHESQFSRIH